MRIVQKEKVAELLIIFNLLCDAIDFRLIHYLQIHKNLNANRHFYLDELRMPVNSVCANAGVQAFPCTQWFVGNRVCRSCSRK